MPRCHIFSSWCHLRELLISFKHKRHRIPSEPKFSGLYGFLLWQFWILKFWCQSYSSGGIACSLVLGFLVSLPSAVGFVCLGLVCICCILRGFPLSHCESLNEAVGLFWVLDDKAGPKKLITAADWSCSCSFGNVKDHLIPVPFWRQEEIGMGKT